MAATDSFLRQHPYMSQSTRSELDDHQPTGRKGKLAGFVHSSLSFTRLEIPELEIFDSSVTFDEQVDPLSAHAALSRVFGRRAGTGDFLFRADSAVPGRYWVRSLLPWNEAPTGALSIHAPQRTVIQLAEGLMYHFDLAVCVGFERVEPGRKHVKPYQTGAEFEAWLRAMAPAFGLRLLLASGAPRTLRFRQGEQGYKVQYGELSGAVEVAEAGRLKRVLLRGLGAHRRLGLGMLRLSQ